MCKYQWRIWQWPQPHVDRIVQLACEEFVFAGDLSHMAFDLSWWKYLQKVVLYSNVALINLNRSNAKDNKVDHSLALKQWHCHAYFSIEREHCCDVNNSNWNRSLRQLIGMYMFWHWFEHKLLGKFRYLYIYCSWTFLFTTIGRKGEL